MSPREPVDTASGIDEGEAFAGALRAHSPDAWSRLYDTHHELIYRYLLVRTSDHSVAEDLAATVFLEALRSIHSYSYRGKPVLAWLYRIARNVLSDHLRARNRFPLERLRALPSEIMTRVRASSQEAGITHADVERVERIDVRQALGRLRASQREVVALRYYLGLTIPEIALLLGKKERAVYSLHERALEALRKLLSPSGEKDFFLRE